MSTIEFMNFKMRKIALKMGGNWLSSGYRHEDIFFKGKGKKKKKPEIIPS